MPALSGLRQELERLLRSLARRPSDVDVQRLALGRILTNQNRELGPDTPFADVEFSIYSQWGDDGIIQFLLRHVDLPAHARSFVEFGVETYVEATTRFLLMNNNWRGLVMDGSAEHIAAVRRDPHFWRYALETAHAFIDRDNINALLKANGFAGEIGLLHIDIDGNEYWIWRAIEVTNPVIVVVEYNATFGAEWAVTVPYDPAFDWKTAHFSCLYFGASLGALVRLGHERGYAFVGCNTAGNNAYFVRRDRLGRLPERSLAEGFVDARFRQSRNARGKPTYLTGRARLEQIADLPVVDVETGQTIPLRALL